MRSITTQVFVLFTSRDMESRMKSICRDAGAFLVGKTCLYSKGLHRNCTTTTVWERLSACFIHNLVLVKFVHRGGAYHYHRRVPTGLDPAKLGAHRS